MQTKILSSFILKVILWLPVCYWIWFKASDFSTWVAADLVTQFFTLNFPEKISGIEQQGYLLDVITRFAPPAMESGNQKGGEIIFTVNPLNYNFGLPLCSALILSSPGKLIPKALNILFSIVILLFIQLWGVSFDILKTIYLELPPQLNLPAELLSWQYNAIALGYQMGALILPAVTPVLIWIAFYSKFIISLAPALQKIKPANS